MPRTKGAKGKRTIAINQAVETAFRMKNTGNKYLLKLADDNPALFVQLLCKCIPQAVAIDLTVHSLDLGLAMRQAQERLNTIDITPDIVAPDNELPVLLPVVSGDAQPALVAPAPATIDDARQSGAPFKRARGQKKEAGGGGGIPRSAEAGAKMRT